MKILILTEGGRNRGFGHLSRCLALAYALRREEPHSELKFVINADRHAKSFLKCNNADFTAMDWVKKNGKVMELIKGSSIVIVDSYLVPESFYKKIASLANRPLVAVIDDYNRLDYPADVIINPSVCDKTGPGYKKNKGIKYLIGAEYVILRKEFLRFRRKRINKKISNILITFGGMNREKFIRKITGFLSDYDFNLTTVSQKVKPLKAEKMRRLMLQADLCVSSGGQTTYELARTGVPTIGICFADNQLYNLKCWQKNGFIEYVGWFSQKDLFVRLSRAIASLCDYRQRNRRSIVGQRTIDGKGAARIAMFLLKEAKNRLILEKPTGKDVLDIWKWRNHPEVRRRCFNKTKIGLKAHKEWFARVSNSPRIKMYIAKQGKNKVGVIRFDEGKSRVIVNVNLNPDFFGRGLGAKLIRSGTTKFIEEKKNKFPEIVANIERDNFVSQEAFAKAGYVAGTNNNVDGYLSYVYKFS